MAQKLTIGALAKRAGVTIKTLRFYSDAGLLPKVGRSPSGYRLYTEEHAARLDLIRALREAGMGLDHIGHVLRSETTLREALTLQLANVQAHIASLERIASALTLAIQAGATVETMRSVTMITQITSEHRRRIISSFYEKVTDGITIDPEWVEGMIEASVAPSSSILDEKQLAAWHELQVMLDDPTFVRCKRVNATDIFTDGLGLDKTAFLDAQVAALAAVNAARLRSVEPSSSEGRVIVEGLVNDLTGLSPDQDASRIRDHMRVKYDPRGARYWELVAVLRGDAEPTSFDDWRWLGQALAHHIAAS